jgi:arylsulfatase
METIDDSTAVWSANYLKEHVNNGEAVFLWVNFTHMHFRTHIKDSSAGQAGRWQSEYHDAMIDHDKNVGTVLDMIDSLGIADNTIVMYSTDNGPHQNTWPDAGTTPFRSEKNTNWEGAYRVPALVRWPGHIKPGSVSNDMISHLDWMPTLLAAAGEPEIKEKLSEGYSPGKKPRSKTYRAQLDGFNMLPLLTGKESVNPRKSFVYVNDAREVTGMRYDNWKFVFKEQRVKGTFKIWAEPFVTLRIPKIFNLRTDPFERADVTSNTYYDWLMDHIYLVYPLPGDLKKMRETLKDSNDDPNESSRHDNRKTLDKLDELINNLEEFSIGK